VRVVQSASTVRALVIDADPEVASARRRALERAGYDVQVAATAEAGADRARQEAPALVVLAPTLPDADAVDLVRLLREDARTRGAALLLEAEELLTDRLPGEGRFRALLEGAPDAIVVVDADGTIELVNQQTERMFGHRGADLVGRPVEVLVPERFRERTVRLRGGVTMVEMQGLRSDGTEFPAEVLLSPLTRNGRVTIAASVRDLTDRSDFLSTLSHELRTPLTAIRGFSEWLVDEWETAPEPQRLEMVRRILHAGGRLEGLVNDLLDFSRLERGGLRVTLAPVALSAVVRTTVADLGSALEQHEVELRLDDELVAMADEPLLARAVENLLTNAAKFSPAGSTVLVRTEARPGAAVVVVRDEGMGIPADEQDKVFDRFYRVPETATHHPGTGIGLAIVQQFVEAQGGSVTLRSRPGEGAEFTLRLVAGGAVP
jgi:two-component system, OmpR family, phosphate regulon sensor histidine kinase PhoR